MREKGAGEKGKRIEKIELKKGRQIEARWGKRRGRIAGKKRMFFFLLLSFFLLPSSFLPPLPPYLTFGTANLHPTLQIARVKRVGKVEEMNPAKHDNRCVQQTENNPRQRCNNE